jgi:hypothetical protein
MPILTNRHCEAKVSQRTKIYDKRCPGLYASITTAGVATFSFKFTDQCGERQTLRLGTYHPDTFTVKDARTMAYHLKAQIGRGEDVIKQARHAKATQAVKRRKTVSEIVNERMVWIMTPERKRDGELRPRIESWKTLSAYSIVSPFRASAK